MSRIVAIPGIAGQQQGAVARTFKARGWEVRGVTRTPRQTEFGETHHGDLETGARLAESFEGAQVVAFTLPQDHRDGMMVQMARCVAGAAKAAGVRRVILNLAGSVDENSDLALFTDMRAARDVICDARVESTVLQPTIYMDNLLAPWSLPGIVKDGVLAYPAPADAAISWLSHRTLGDFFVAAAEREDAGGEVYRIGGPEALTGNDLVNMLGERLGKPISYQRIPLDAFASGLNAAIGPPAGDRIASLYARLDAEPRAMDVGDMAVRALGVAPETFAQFVARQDWRLPESAADR